MKKEITSVASLSEEILILLTKDILEARNKGVKNFEIDLSFDLNDKKMASYYIWTDDEDYKRIDT